MKIRINNADPTVEITAVDITASLDQRSISIYEDKDEHGKDILIVQDNEKSVQIKATMVEFLADTNSWRYYDIRLKLTPKEAVKRYLQENGLNDEQAITNEKDTWYAQEDDVRAYEIKIN